MVIVTRIPGQQLNEKNFITENAIPASELRLRMRVAGFGYMSYPNVGNKLCKSFSRIFSSFGGGSNK